MSQPVLDPKTKMLSGRRVLGWVAVVGGLLAVKACAQADNSRAGADIAAKARVRRQFQHFDYRLDSTLKNDSALQAAVRGLSASETRAKLRELSGLGFPRLNSKEQVRRFAQLGAVYKAAPEDACIDENWVEMLAFGLDSAGVQAFFELNLAAIQAEIRGLPALQTDSTAVVWARQTILNSLPPADRKIFLKKEHPSTPLTGADRCAVNRAIYGGILALPESQRPDYAKAVATWVAAP